MTEHNLEFLSLKGGCTGSYESTMCQNVTLLEITCRGSYYTTMIILPETVPKEETEAVI